MSDPVAAGWRTHSGWAVLVTVSRPDGAPTVAARKRVDLIGPGLPRQPFHAVAEDGAPRSVIRRVEDTARRRALAALRAIASLAAVGLVAAERALPDDLDRVLASHARLHAAEGALYVQAVVGAAADAGLPVHVLPPDRVAVDADVAALGRILGPPWQQDHKWAATAALIALERAGP